ncbi:MAG: hypothetical protein AAGF36_06150 [Pseudomonadota bacterium]
MSVWVWTLVAVVCSSLAIARLVTRDPKRGRAFGVPFSGNEGRAGSWVLLLVPGVVLLVLDQFAAFMIWAGAVPLIGWGWSVLSPERHAAFQAWRMGVMARMRDVHIPRPRPLRTRRKARIAALEARVAELEQLLHDTRAPRSAAE